MDFYLPLLFELNTRHPGDELLEPAGRAPEKPASERDFAFGCVLPEQHFEVVNRKFSVTAEGRLLLAVLDDAIALYLRTMNRTSRVALIQFCEVDTWFSTRNHRDLFAFENICEVFRIDSDTIRRRLQALRNEDRRLGTSDACSRNRFKKAQPRRASTI